MQFTNIDAKKIDGIIHKTYEIVIATFLVINQTNQIQFFEKIFIMANINPNIVFEMLFFILNGVYVNFLKRKLE